MLENLRMLREEKGLTQKQLAEAIGVSQQSINKYENHNIEPDIQTMVRIADLFQTSVDYLVGHSEIRGRIEPVRPFELNDEEARLLLRYRELNGKQRALVDSVVASYLE